MREAQRNAMQAHRPAFAFYATSPQLFAWARRPTRSTVALRIAGACASGWADQRGRPSEALGNTRHTSATEALPLHFSNMARVAHIGPIRPPTHSLAIVAACACSLGVTHMPGGRTGFGSRIDGRPYMCIQMDYVRCKRVVVALFWCPVRGPLC